ncbi:magnesium transporter CorA family protein [Paenibacillus eucommiae]|uniref:Mg2+ and Co2+ transporter CorA n=1 Tax=Paenibacillus eucommiae TaxID=1355755 RepID=A0ABS4ING7_9BACL|nr:magnesium transporter CorA family protein [Paenibacillus eucommiae]MBP1989103.1 Mg2+ and Co2+ transporter CorA [Paenibacillus eucommiae]
MALTIRKFHTGWNWQQFHQSDEVQIDSNQEADTVFIQWLERGERVCKNSVGVHVLGDNKAFYGFLEYGRDPEKIGELPLLRYYVTQDKLVTNELNQQFWSEQEQEELIRKLEFSKSAVDGFFVLIGEIINKFLEGIDDFEESLRMLEIEMKEGRNRGSVLDEIIKHRYLLLHWTSLTIPLQEISLAAEEVYLDDLEQSEDYKRTKLRLERIVTLQNYYEKQIDTLLSIDDNLTNYRGNEIMRALTVFTAIFTPVMAFAAIWGMNFEEMPELEWQWGYFGSLAFIFISTLFVYLWLLKKGWLGDLLKGKSQEEKNKV